MTETQQNDPLSALSHPFEGASMPPQIHPSEHSRVALAGEAVTRIEVLSPFGMAPSRLPSSQANTSTSRQIGSSCVPASATHAPYLEHAEKLGMRTIGP